MKLSVKRMKSGKFDTHTRVIIALSIAAAVFILYWPVRTFDFLNFDDFEYVTENRLVRNGLSLHAIKMSFSTIHVSNWHPLTIISHMIDCSLFGLNPAGHHIMNAGFHAANAVLLFLLLYAITGSIGISTAISILWAFHPLNVESVAWIAERKNVLSTFWLFLALWGYIAFIRKRNPWRYAMFTICFALGLLSKPMLVTFPFVLLLIDYWPLNRFSSNGSLSFKKVRNAFIEKIPLFGLTILFCFITFYVQKSAGAVGSNINYNFGVRAANALISYLVYIGAVFIPKGLAVFYPHPEQTVSVPFAVAAGMLLVILSWLLCIVFRKKQYLTTGWLWYLGTLVPVIGLVQVGRQSHADRYMYVPILGLLIIIVWLAGIFAKKIKISSRWLTAVTIIIATALTVTTRNQLSFWKNNFTLFSHTAKVTRNNYIAYNQMGIEYGKRGKINEAESLFAKAIAINPNYDRALYNMGKAMIFKGDTAEARQLFIKAIKISPNYNEAYNNLGALLLQQGNKEKALEYLETAVRLRPDSYNANLNLGRAYEQLGRLNDAKLQYRKTIKLNPRNISAYNYLGSLFYYKHNYQSAKDYFEYALRLSPKNSDIYFNLGLVMTSLGQTQKAINYYKRVLQLKPDYEAARINLNALTSR